MNEVLMGNGQPLARGTEMNRMSGYTTIDTPTQEDLYCEFQIDVDGDVTLRFQDRTTANLIAEMVLGGAFQGFQIQAKPARRRN